MMMRKRYTQVMRPLALALLAAFVSADPGTGVLQAIFDSGLPGRLMQDLLETPGRALLQVACFLCCILLNLDIEY